MKNHPVGEIKEDLEALIHLITEKYHFELRQSLEEITFYLEKLVLDHGDDVSDLLEAKNLFTTWSGHLLFHLEREEQILFPLILSYQKDPQALPSISGLVSLLEKEHEQETDVMTALKQIMEKAEKKMSSNRDFQKLKALLNNMIENLKEHIDIEDHRLFAYFKS